MSLGRGECEALLATMLISSPHYPRPVHFTIGFHDDPYRLIVLPSRCAH
jgi:hypothetical protein